MKIYKNKDLNILIMTVIRTAGCFSTHILYDLKILSLLQAYNMLIFFLIFTDVNINININHVVL